jgi:hypothetical protein
MPAFKMGCITVNGRFHSNSLFCKSNVWQLDREEFLKILPCSRKYHNFIKFPFDNGVTAMIYTKGGFKLVVTKANFKHILENMSGVVHYIKQEFATKLFSNELITSSYNVTQVFFSIQADIENNEVKLSFEKLMEVFKAEPFGSVINISFQNVCFQFEIDHTQHESGCSHFTFKIISGDKELATCNIYSNFKATILTKYTKHMS